MDFSKVKDKYPDSISQFEFTEILNNPSHGKLNFSEVEEVFSNMLDIIYQLELRDFRAILFPEDRDRVENFRNDIKNNFIKIQDFDISQANSTQIRQGVIANIQSFYSNQYGKIYAILRNVKIDNLLSDPAADSLDDLLTKANEDSNRIEEIKTKMENYVKEAKKGVEETGISKGEVGSLELAKFFLEQSKIHEKNAIGDDGNGGWLYNRKIFFCIIAVWLIVNIILYVLKIFEINFFTRFFSIENIIEYGVLSLAVLLLLYIGMSFATNNYSVEKQLEVENKHRSNIGKTLQLFLATPQSENSRSIVLQEGISVLFSNINGNYSKSKIQTVTTPATEIINIAKNVKDIAR